MKYRARHAEENEESLEHKRDAFDRTDHQMVKADLKAEAQRKCEHRFDQEEFDEDSSSSAVEQECSHERRVKLDQDDSP